MKLCCLATLAVTVGARFPGGPDRWRHFLDFPIRIRIRMPHRSRHVRFRFSYRIPHAAANRKSDVRIHTRANIALPIFTACRFEAFLASVFNSKIDKLIPQHQRGVWLRSLWISSANCADNFSRFWQMRRSELIFGSPHPTPNCLQDTAHKCCGCANTYYIIFP